MAKWKEIPSPEAIVRAALERADHAAQIAANNAESEAEHVVIIAAVENIRSLASNPAKVAAIIKAAGEGSGISDAIGTLVFMNADATPKNVSVQCTPESVPPIMAWYGAYFSGDRYTVAFNGRNIWMDINGECLNTLAELKGENDD